MRGKKYDPHIVAEFVSRHKESELDSEKKAAVDGFMQITGCSRTTAYNILQRSQTRSIQEIATAQQNRQQRKSEFELASIKRDMIRLAAIKQQPGPDKSKWIATTRAIEIGEALGYLSEGEWTRSTADRWLEYFGLNKSLTQKPARAASRITANYSNEVWLLDATPMEQYYLRLDMTPVKLDIPEGDKHLDDILRRENCVKIWVYYMVDMYSRAFIAWPSVADPIGIKSKNQGESAQSWIEAIKFFMLPKGRLNPLYVKDSYRQHPFVHCPVEGAPKTVFSDKGSGIGKSTNKTLPFLYNFDIKVRTHSVGNPAAKGSVESRIGAYKRSVECQFIREKIKTVDELVYLYCTWADYLNRKKGYYDAYVQGLDYQTLRRVSPQNIQDALVVQLERTLTKFGTVSIDSEEFFVTAEGRYIGEKVKLYRRVDSLTGEITYTAEMPDMKIFTCVLGAQSHHFDERPNVEITPEEENRNEAAQMAAEVRRTMTFDDMLPPEIEKKVVHIVPAAQNVTVNTPSLPDRISDKKQAINWLLSQTALFWEEIPEQTRTAVEHMLDLNLNSGGIPRELLMQISNTLNDDQYWQTQYENHQREGLSANK